MPNKLNLPQLSIMYQPNIYKVQAYSLKISLMCNIGPYMIFLNTSRIFQDNFATQGACLCRIYNFKLRLDERVTDHHVFHEVGEWKVKLTFT